MLDVQSQLKDIGLDTDVLTKAKKRLNELNKEWPSQCGVCYGSTMELDGTETKGHTACHAWVGAAYKKITGSYGWSSDYKKGAKPFLTLTCHSKTTSKASAEATDAIILWMAQSTDSPFSQFILNRDDTDSLLNGGAIILCGPGGATQAQSMWMCKVLRYSTEGSTALDVWHTLYKGGVNPVLAVLVCSFISSIKGATFTAAAVSAHVAVYTNSQYNGARESLDVHGIMSFSFNKSADNTYSVFKQSDADKAVKQIGKTDAVSKITGFCKPFAKDDGWGGKITGNGVTGEELVQRVLEWQEELGGWKPQMIQANAPVVEPDPVVFKRAAPKPRKPKKTDVFIDFDL